MNKCAAPLFATHTFSGTFSFSLGLYWHPPIYEFFQKLFHSLLSNPRQLMFALFCLLLALCLVYIILLSLFMKLPIFVFNGCQIVYNFYLSNSISHTRSAIEVVSRLHCFVALLIIVGKHKFSSFLHDKNYWTRSAWKYWFLFLNCIKVDGPKWFENVSDCSNRHNSHSVLH